MKIGILWDLDGTLLDTLADLVDGTNHALAQFGLPPRTAPEVRRFVGNGAARLIAQALPGRADDPPADDVVRVFHSYYAVNCIGKTKPYSGIPEALEVLGKKYPMAIVSNKPDSAVKPLCDKYFPGMYARGESPDCPRKPDPAMVRKAMESIGVERCIYVGDSEVDVLTAQNAGVPCLSVLWGFRDEAQLREVGADHFCDDPARLAEMIEKMTEELSNGK